MVNNLAFRWPKPLFFVVLGAHGIYTCIYIYIYIIYKLWKRCLESFRKDWSSIQTQQKYYSVVPFRHWRIHVGNLSDSKSQLMGWFRRNGKASPVENDHQDIPYPTLSPHYHGSVEKKYPKIIWRKLILEISWKNNFPRSFGLVSLSSQGYLVAGWLPWYDMCHGQGCRVFWGWETSHLLIGILIMGIYTPTIGLMSLSPIIWK